MYAFWTAGRIRSRKASTAIAISGETRTKTDRTERYGVDVARDELEAAHDMSCITVDASINPTHADFKRLLADAPTSSYDNKRRFVDKAGARRRANACAPARSFAAQARAKGLGFKQTNVVKNPTVKCDTVKANCKGEKGVTNRAGHKAMDTAPLPGIDEDAAPDRVKNRGIAFRKRGGGGDACPVSPPARDSEGESFSRAMAMAFDQFPVTKCTDKNETRLEAKRDLKRTSTLETMDSSLRSEDSSHVESNSIRFAYWCAPLRNEK